MRSQDRLVGSTPCCDIGDALKPFYNSCFSYRQGKPAVQDGVEVTVVGSGSHIGNGTKTFLSESTKRLMYFSYRNRFPRHSSGLSTDAMWGCLVRTSQMLLSVAFMRYFSDGASVLPTDNLSAVHARVGKLFMDIPSAPFGIHVLMEEGSKAGVPCGSWFTPTQIARAMTAAAARFLDDGGDGPVFMCCEGRDIHLPTVWKALRQKRPILLLIPVMMGIGRLSDSYERVLLYSFGMESTCGIAGGFKSSSIFMFARQGNLLFFHDPHYVQKAFTSEKHRGKTYNTIGTLAAKKFNTGMLMGFYVHDEAAMHRFLTDLDKLNSFLRLAMISVSGVPPPASHEDIHLTASPLTSRMDDISCHTYYTE